MLPSAPFVTKSFKLLAIVASVAAILLSDCVWAQTFVDRQSTDSFRLANYNVYSDELFEFANRDELIRFVNAVDADVYTFQEVFASSTEAGDIFDQIAPLPTGSWQVHKGRNQLIVSRFPLSLRLTNVPGGTRGIAMAQVDLPDEHFSNDMYILNNHFPCCDSGENQRIVESVAIVEWMADALTPGGNINLTADTAVAVVGDLNTVGGPVPRSNLLNGIGSLRTDWDGSSMTDANPTHNNAGLADYTWRDDTSFFPPSILDYIMYTDSVISAEHSFILNPSIMPIGELEATGLFATDMMRTKSISTGDFDHLPLIVDFAANAPPRVILLGDVNQDGVVGFLDVAPLTALFVAGDYLEEADCNLDGAVNFFDIAPFIAILTGN